MITKGASMCDVNGIYNGQPTDLKYFEGLTSKSQQEDTRDEKNTSQDLSNVFSLQIISDVAAFA